MAALGKVGVNVKAPDALGALSRALVRTIRSVDFPPVPRFFLC